MNFATRLKDLRKREKLTQEELALKINKTRSTIAGYETERKQPDYETLKTLASFFDVTVDYLIGHSDVSKLKDTFTSDELLPHIPPDVIESFKKLDIKQIKFVKKMAEEEIDPDVLLETIQSLEKYFAKNKDDEKE